MKLLALIVDNRDTIDFKPIYKRHMDFLPKSTPLVHYNVPQTSTFEGYNILLTDPNFWQEFIEYDKVLIFQHDSGLLRKGIESFYKYDYVGAPWIEPKYGGNGGLSLRTPKVMIEILFNYPHNQIKAEDVIGTDSVQLNEDIFFSYIMHTYNIGKLAPRKVCSKFSVETIFKLGTLGYHAIEKHQEPSKIKLILDQYKFCK